MRRYKRERNLSFIAGCFFFINVIITLKMNQFILVPILLLLASIFSFVAAYKADQKIRNDNIAS